MADVRAVGTQIKGNAPLTSLDEMVASDDDLGEPLLRHDVLASSQEDPAKKAARSMDWQEFMAGLSKRAQAIIRCVTEGKPLSSLARKRHLNSSTMLYHKRRPGWRDSISCTRERLAVREERRQL